VARMDSGWLSATATDGVEPRGLTSDRNVERNLGPKPVDQHKRGLNAGRGAPRSLSTATKAMTRVVDDVDASGGGRQGVADHGAALDATVAPTWRPLCPLSLVGLSTQSTTWSPRSSRRTSPTKVAPGCANTRGPSVRSSVRQPGVTSEGKQPKPMSSVVRRGQRQQEGPASPQSDGSLPLRWGLIMMAAVSSGLAVGFTVDLVPGITVGLAMAGLLHKVLART
jgi:hypothetical protein